MWSWHRRWKETCSIGFTVKTDRIILKYQHKFRDGEWVPVKQEIKFNNTSCNYGGYRTWFLCTGCGRRVAVLYAAGKYFLCRLCNQLTYRSQRENKIDRLMRKSRKIRALLGASKNLIEPILFKPKNMHWDTFIRLKREADYASNLAIVMMGRQQLGIKMDDPVY